MGITEKQIDTVTEHYIIAAVWADCKEGTHPKVPNEQKAKARKVCADFIELCEKRGGLFTKAMERFEHGYGTHPDAGSAEAMFGHDFWLTRQGHGVGFWDRKVLEVTLEDGTELGDALSAVAREVGESYHYQDRGWFYLTDR